MKREIEFAATGYGRYYWRAFLDGVSGTYFTEAIVPVILREDPRYYTLGHGGLRGFFVEPLLPSAGTWTAPNTARLGARRWNRQR